MATSSRFKQPCPSCEARIPIRDPQLIGRQIDCPNFGFSEPLGGLWEQLTWWAGLFSYLACVLLAGLLAAALLPV